MSQVAVISYCLGAGVGNPGLFSFFFLNIVLPLSEKYGYLGALSQNGRLELAGASRLLWWVNNRFSLLFFPGGGNAMPGYIKLFREIQEDWTWQLLPFSPGQAWVDILLLANHATKKVPFDGGFVEVERGQFITSIRKLGKRWGWSRTKVINFLTSLQNDNKISVFSDTKKTVITVIKYDYWQGCQDTKKPQKSHRKDTKKPQKSLNKNDKKGKNEKKKEYILLANRIIDYFNQITGMKKECCETNQDIIRIRAEKRIKEGKELAEIEEEMRRVIRVKYSHWKDSPEMQEYIRLDTLIQRKKYYEYIDQKERMDISDKGTPDYSNMTLEEKRKAFGVDEWKSGKETKQ
jgi:uncharacterized phage protein (TIGR02220 family)